MGIKHTFTSAVPDSSDLTRVRPSNWNADHVIDGDVNFAGFGVTNFLLPVAYGGTGQTTEAEAVGELIQALTADSNPDIQADYVSVYDASGDTGKKVLLNTIGSRPRLTADLTLYLRTDPIAVTISNASPAVATATAHGFQAGDPVVFSNILDARVATITIASPAVVDTAVPSPHGFAAGDPIVFRTSNAALPTGITASTPTSTTSYYVIAAGLTASAFEFSTSVGGAAVNTSGTQSGRHLVERASVFPTGVTEGSIYYVISTGLATDSFQFSTVAGGSAVNTSGAQVGKLYVQTGNDDNDGTANDRSHAMLTVPIMYQQRICGHVNTDSLTSAAGAAGYDLNGWAVTVQCADGYYDCTKYQTGFQTRGAGIAIDGGDCSWTGSGALAFYGNTAAYTLRRSQVRWKAQNCIYFGDNHSASADGQLLVRSIRLLGTSDPVQVNGPIQVVVTACDVGHPTAGSSSGSHFLAEDTGCHLSIFGQYTMLNNCAQHMCVSSGAEIEWGADLEPWGACAVTNGWITNSDGGEFRIPGGTYVIYGDFATDTFAVPTNNGVTGCRFSLSHGTVVGTFGGPIDRLPGTIEGEVFWGASYDNLMGIDDLQIANGAVWQWNANSSAMGGGTFAADITLTHTTDTLTLSGGKMVFGDPPVVPSYTVVGVPSASPAGQLAYISNESGGAVLAFSDATNWRRVTDRAIIT